MPDTHSTERRWPEGGNARIPFWLYTDPEIYRLEQERVFAGKSWNYVALEAEIPEPGDFKRSFAGDRPVVVVRGQGGGVNVVVNRCAHRGVQFCKAQRGNAKEFTCPYHQWVYDLEGNLLGVPFRRGLKGQGGMPDDFDFADHGLQTLRVAVRGGAVFASFDGAVESFEDYLGPSMLGYFDRVFDGRPLTLLGYQRQRVPSNWKLMFENLKDPYHASLMHVFLVTFGLFRADNPSKVQMDESGRHAVQASVKGEQKLDDSTAQMASFKDVLELNDPGMLTPIREFEEYTVVMQTIWPNLIIQQQSNTLATRHIVPRGPGAFDLHWTYFGYEGDDEQMTLNRLRQANLMGPAGFVSIDDGEVMEHIQDGVAPYPGAEGVVEMGGLGTGDEEHMVTEASIRSFYKYYREVMGL